MKTIPRQAESVLIQRGTGDEAARCVLNGLQECKDMPLEETIAIMEVIVRTTPANVTIEGSLTTRHLLGRGTKTEPPTLSGSDRVDTVSPRPGEARSHQEATAHVSKLACRQRTMVTATKVPSSAP